MFPLRWVLSPSSHCSSYHCFYLWLRTTWMSPRVVPGSLWKAWWLKEAEINEILHWSRFVLEVHLISHTCHRAIVLYRLAYYTKLKGHFVSRRGGHTRKKYTLFWHSLDAFNKSSQHMASLLQHSTKNETVLAKHNVLRSRTFPKCMSQNKLKNKILVKQKGKSNFWNKISQ